MINWKTIEHDTPGKNEPITTWVATNISQVDLTVQRFLVNEKDMDDGWNGYVMNCPPMYTRSYLSSGNQFDAKHEALDNLKRGLKATIEEIDSLVA